MGRSRREKAKRLLLPRCEAPECPNRATLRPVILLEPLLPPAGFRPADRARVPLPSVYCDTHAEAARIQHAMGRPLIAEAAWAHLEAVVLELRGIRVNRATAGLDMEPLEGGSATGSGETGE